MKITFTLPSWSGRCLVGAWALLLLPLLSWGQVVISQVYGGGGNSGATYSNDFVELHNISNNPVTITGYVLQYAAATAAFANPTTSNSLTLSGSIPAGGYYLIGLASGGSIGLSLPATDASNPNLNLNATVGKIVLASNSSTNGITPNSSNTIDFVGYGSTASAYEGNAVAPSSTGNTFSIVRGNNGCTDTNQNSTDFTVATTITPRNSSTAVNSCSSAPTYVWTGTTSTSWSDPTNWSPSRITPGAIDILKFDGTVTPNPNVVINFSSSQTIGQLLLVNNVNATFSTDDNRTLTIDNNLPGDDFVVSSGASLAVTNGNTSVITALTISLTSAETGNVAGNVIFAGNTAQTGRHILQATGTNAVQFVSGSLFRQALTYDGSAAFGSTANSIIFRNGSRYEQYGGGNPFSLIQPASLTTFEPNSYYLFALNTGGSSLAGRTFGNLELASSTTGNGAGTLTVQGNLIVSNGTTNLSTSGANVQGNVLVSGTATLNVTSAASLLGNVTVNGTATLNFLPTAAATIVLAGSTAQTVGGNSTAASPISVGSSSNSNPTLQINNASGVVLGLPVAVYGTLQLTSGLLTTSNANLLTLYNPSTSSVTDGSDASFVNGPVQRPVGSTTSGTTYVFPIGKGSAYRPLSLLVNTQVGSTFYRAEQFEGNINRTYANPDPSGTPLTRVNGTRYFTLAPYNTGAASAVLTQPAGFTGNVRLSFGADDKVTDPSVSTLVVAKRSTKADPWANIGRNGYSGTTSGTLTSGIITTFSDFTLGSTSADFTVNPLPVQLARFTAQRAEVGVVALTWTTASELNSARFEVERSSDGLTFAPVATVAAQGNSAQAHDYATRDAAAPAGSLYYRLKLVDLDGTFTYSPTVALAGGTGTSLAAYPNPTTSELTLPGAAGQPVSLLDALGRPVRQLTLGASERLDMSGLPAGLYLLRVPDRPAQRITKE